jgi:hypothetical protein
MTDSTKIEIEIPEEPTEKVEEVQEQVDKLEGKVETLTEVVSEPPEIPEHEHAFHHEILTRLSRLEDTTDTLVKREVTRTVDDMHEKNAEQVAEAEAEEEIQESTPKETTITTEEIPPDPTEEVTIIEPPVERSRKETPPGIWGVIKKMGF